MKKVIPYTIVLVIGICCVMLNFANANEQKVSLTLEQRVAELEKKVSSLTTKVDLLRRSKTEYVKITQKGNTTEPRDYPFYNGTSRRPHKYRSNTEYTYRSNRQIHNPEQAERDDYERKHK